MIEAVYVERKIAFWDPLNLLKNADQARFDRLRKVEVKHGRISMLVILGHLVTTSFNSQYAYKHNMKALVPFPPIEVLQSQFRR